MTKSGAAILLAIALIASPLSAQSGSRQQYTSARTPIGTLLADPAARAVLARRFPALLQSRAVVAGRANRFTLRTLKRVRPAMFTDAALAGADADFAALPGR